MTQSYTTPDGTQHYSREGMRVASVRRCISGYEIACYYGPESNERRVGITRGYDRAVNIALRHAERVAA
jgi:hypothetical protein